MGMFDTSNRRYLPPCGARWDHAPNYQRLAERCVTFDRAFVDSMPQKLKENGIYSHLVSDHDNCCNDGGATYHTRYCSWQMSRGQIVDWWVPRVGVTDNHYGGSPQNNAHWPPWRRRQDLIHRSHITCEPAQPMPKAFRMGLEFLDTNGSEDNWFLQLETFDPHEPFVAPSHYRDLYPYPYDYGTLSRSIA